MKLGIIGAGRIGGTAARLFARAGHEVVLSNSRGPASLEDLVATINREVGGSRVGAATAAEAAKFGEIVLLAAPWRAQEALPGPELVRGKIVIDAMNAYGASGSIIDLGGFTSSEEVAKRLPGARLVKAFNTIYYQHLAQQGRPDAPLEQRRAIFIAGDDVAAKKVVSGLIQEIGFAPVDTGTLREGGRSQEPGTPVYNRDLTYSEAVTILATAS
jgi:8-hydroxy-5-deazaflavin:NADPH oxidoreductase